MRIGLDGIPLCEKKTGIGHYTFELAQALARAAPYDELVLLSPHKFLCEPDDPTEDIAWEKNLRAEQVPVRHIWRHWFAAGLQRHLKTHEFDLFHGTNYEIPFLRRLKHSTVGGALCPSVLTIHDLSLLLYPQTHEARLVRRGRVRLPLMTRAAEMIIAPTEAVRREIIEHLRVAPGKVVAVHEAPRRIFRPQSPATTRTVREKFNLPEEFILFVGTIEPRKNLTLLIRALAEVVRHTEARPPLVIAGRTGWLTGEFLTQLRASELNELVHLTGYVTEADLRALYSACRMFVYPSLYEGFGLPPLEAMACGAPVIASRIGAHEEVLGDAARLVEPDNVWGMVESLIDFWADAGAREFFARRGRERAARFSWAYAAQLTLGVYEEALARALRLADL